MVALYSHYARLLSSRLVSDYQRLCTLDLDRVCVILLFQEIRRKKTCSFLNRGTSLSWFYFRTSFRHLCFLFFTSYHICLYLRWCNLMVKVKRRKVPISNIARANTSSSKQKTSRNVIRRFHILIKGQEKLKNKNSFTVSEAEELDKINDEIQRLGGLEWYQQMSVAGQGNDRGGGSEKFFIEWLKELQVHEGKQEALQYVFRASCDLPHRILAYRVAPGCWKSVPWNLTTTSFALLGYTIHRSTCIHGILTSKNRTSYFWTQAEIRKSGVLLVSVLCWISYQSQETEVSRAERSMQTQPTQ